MIDKDLIGFISRKLKIERREFIEKDIILQSLLLELSKDKDFSDKYAFKGGTCLIKCYLGYYRFSEDLDFTFIDKTEFSGNSEKAIRKMISVKIAHLAELFEKIAKKLDLDFKAEKNNKQYIQLGGSNRFTTFKIWYDSSVINAKSFVKIQINFVEDLLYSVGAVRVKSLVNEEMYNEIKFVFSEYSYLNEPIKIKAYALEEILIEKIRAILSRRGIKARDFVDVFLIINLKKINIESFKKQIIQKIEFMLRYEKYSDNLKAKKEQIEKDIELGKEANTLLKPLPEGFDKFIQEFKPFLQSIISSIKE